MLGYKTLCLVVLKHFHDFDNSKQFDSDIKVKVTPNAHSSLIDITSFESWLVYHGMSHSFLEGCAMSSVGTVYGVPSMCVDSFFESMNL